MGLGVFLFLFRDVRFTWRRELLGLLIFWMISLTLYGPCGTGLRGDVRYVVVVAAADLAALAVVVLVERAMLMIVLMTVGGMGGW